MDYLTSMYIDNELDLEEKREFVEYIRKDRAFYAQTLDLISQELLLRTPVAMPAPAPQLQWRLHPGRWLALLFRPMGYAAAGFCAAALLYMAAMGAPEPPPCHNRFVLYEPAARQVALAGTFTQWERVTLTPIGQSGYWEVYLKVPRGEHRYAYFLDGNRRVADPTLPNREKDDFGGTNSIFHVGEQI